MELNEAWLEQVFDRVITDDEIDIEDTGALDQQCLNVFGYFLKNIEAKRTPKMTPEMVRGEAMRVSFVTAFLAGWTYAHDIIEVPEPRTKKVTIPFEFDVEEVKQALIKLWTDEGTD